MILRTPAWFLETIWTTGIIAFLVVSVIPLGRTPLFCVESGDKIAHAGAFPILALFPAATGAVSMGTAIFVLFLVAVGSELMQTLVVYRSGEMLDIAADLSGMFAGLAIGGVISRCFLNQHKHSDLKFVTLSLSRS